MQMMRHEVSIGGVPEHFNLPFYLAVEEARFDHLPYRVSWTDMPAGTGAMCQALEDGTLDIAVLLTEGIVAHIARGGSARLIGSYTRSPLVWGVHVAAEGPIREVSELEGGRFAVSRFGSGSHLMAVVQAAELGWPSSGLSFEVAGGLDGGRAALAEGRAQAFMWERTMSKPLVDAGEWRRIADFAAPWPAFMVAASPAFIEEQQGTVSELLGSVRGYCERLVSNRDDAATLIAAQFALDRGDARAWMDHIQWSCSEAVDRASIARVARGLIAAGVLEGPVDIEALFSATRAVKEL